MPYRNFLLKSFGSILIIGFLTTACQDASSDPKTASDGGWATIPALSTGGNCAELKASPELCEWVGSVDAIAIVEIHDLQMAATPAVLSDGSEQLVNECDGVVNNYLKMDVSVDQTLAGNLPANLTVRVGVSQIDLWSPRPVKPEGESMQWLGDLSPLEVGQKVGLALHYDNNDDIWSLMGELMFTIQPDASNANLVHFQDFEMNECAEPPPENAQGTNFEVFRQAISACPTDPSEAAIARRNNILGSWGARPENYKSAVCIPQ